LIKQAELVLSDSGGIQEETTFLGVPCITLRTTTERPSTLSIGTNQLLGNDLEKAKSAALAVLSGETKTGRIPELWDGKAAERIAKILTDQLL
jgi:UDP-N-acetylglucosamine 2-epimerase (non-hydrolysing)